MDATAWATVGLAVVTALLAGATAYMARKTSGAVEEAKNQTQWQPTRSGRCGGAAARPTPEACGLA
jgi:hypothetical protein